MMMTNNMANKMQNNWDQVKGQVKRKWAKLTDTDMDDIDGSYDQLVEKLKTVYHYKSDEVKNKVKEFWDKLDIDNMEDAKDNLKSMAEDSMESIKKQSQVMVDYAKENPLKAAGIMTAVGFLVGKLFSMKK